MKITHLYTGSDGESHFGDIEVPLKCIGDIIQRSDVIKATGVFFTEIDGDSNWHNASHRQFGITLEGRMEIEVGDGTKRQFGPGDIFLAEDTTGRGHISRTMDNRPRKTIFVTLD